MDGQLILSQQSIRREGIVSPLSDRTVFKGVSYGLGPCSYDIRVAETFWLPPHGVRLASSMERLRIPNNIAVENKNKSTWARRFVDASLNTLADPGFEGYLTIEIVNHHPEMGYKIEEGMGILQLLFMWLDEPTESPYRGKYFGQPNRPIGAIDE